METKSSDWYDELKEPEQVDVNELQADIGYFLWGLLVGFAISSAGFLAVFCRMGG